MKLITSDEQRVLEIGTNNYLFCFYSTVYVNLAKKYKDISLAIEFLRDGECNGCDGYIIARQFNLIRDRLSNLDVSKIVYDMTDPKKKAPWINNISFVVTSCGNFFITSEGKDLIFEISSILCYAKVKNVDVYIKE